MDEERKKLWILRLCSFLQVCTVGLFAAFEAVHMSDNGISARWIGIIMGLENCLLIFSGPLWGRIADKSFHFKRVIYAGAIGMSFNLLWFAQSDSLNDFLIYAAIRGIFFSAMMGIMPALALANLTKMGKGKGYGGYRSYGSLGFMTVTMLFPLIFGRIDFMAYTAACILPFSILAIRKLDNPKKQKKSATTRWRDMPRDFYIFMLASFFSFLSEPGIHGFFSAYAKDQGASLQLVGLLSGMTGFIALLSLQRMGKWVDKSGVKLILFIAFFAQPSRLLITSLISNPELLWIPHLLHVFGWAGKEIATIIFLSNLVGPDKQATAITLNVSLRMSGMTIGSLMMGYLADTYNYVTMFQIMSAISFIGFFILFKIKKFNRGS